MRVRDVEPLDLGAVDEGDVNQHLPVHRLHDMGQSGMGYEYAGGSFGLRLEL